MWCSTAPTPSPTSQFLPVIYVACWIYFGLSTFRKGHFWLFWIGFFFPFLWIIGALIAPTSRAAARMA